LKACTFDRSLADGLVTLRTGSGRVTDYWCQRLINVSAFFAEKSTDTNNGAIKLERVESPGAKVKAPRILESHGTAPAQYPDWEG